jgi:hypothetical protein
MKEGKRESMKVEEGRKECVRRMVKEGREEVERRKEGRTDGRMEGRKEGRKDGRMGGQTYGRKEGRKEGSKNRLGSPCTLLFPSPRPAEGQKEEQRRREEGRTEGRMVMVGMKGGRKSRKEGTKGRREKSGEVRK